LRKRDFLLLTFAIVVDVLGGYFLAFLPFTMSNAETSGRIYSFYSRTAGILDQMSGDVTAYFNHSIDDSTFMFRIITLKNNMTALRTELTEMRAVAFPTYARSIDLLDSGLQSYINALNSAVELNFEQTSQNVQQGTQYIKQSKNTLP
jgi:hypothetical protein